MLFITGLETVIFIVSVIVILFNFLLVVIAFLGSIINNWKRNWSSRTALQEPKVQPPAFFSPANKINRFYFFPAQSKIYYWRLPEAKTNLHCCSIAC